MGYSTAMWLTFGTSLAAVAGALTGLLFVAVSVKSDVVAASRSLVSGTALLILDRRAGHGATSGVASYIEKFSPNTITAVLVGIAGITFLLKAGGGLYWLIPATAASILGGVVNAWLFLVRLSG